MQAANKRIGLSLLATEEKWKWLYQSWPNLADFFQAFHQAFASCQLNTSMYMHIR